MKKSKFTILLLFLVMILSISAASAADLDDTSDSAVQAADEATVDEVASADVDDVVSTDNAANVLADPAVSTSKNFTQLKNDIASAPGYLGLTSNYVRVADEEDIEITSSIVIDGRNQYSIDANGLGGIFKINNTESIVVLNNVVLKNGNSTNGGAIYNQGTLTISGSQFTNNSASNGGAIYNLGHLIINSGSTFDDNKADISGGAIYSDGAIGIDTVTFENNKVTNRFNETTKTGGSQGGAIYAIGEALEIKDSTFLENSATPDDHGEGAAIYAEVTTTTISGTTFKSNRGFQGGAVKLIGVDQDTLVFNNCQFESNIALQGGAIDAQGCANLRINGTTFKDNQAYSDRYSGVNPDMGAAAAIGAAYVNDIVIYVNNSKFIHNTVTSGPQENSGFGAAIISTGSLIVDNTEFTDNEADKFATLRVYHNGNAGTVTITNSNFTGNKANKGDAAVLYASASKTTTIDNCKFEDNTAAGNGVIYADGALNVKNSYFKGNKANNTANAIYANNALTLSGNTIDGDAAEIIANGEVNSQINVTILNNGTVDTYADSVTVNATITDDKGNLIANATGFKFVVNGAEAEATYDAVNKIYTGTLALPGPGIYTVNITYTEQDKLKVKTATIKNYKGTFKDLQTKVNGCGGQLVLNYDFTYTPGLDDSSYITGIYVINVLNVTGNGHTISGNGAARIFKVSGTTLNLTNLTIRDGKASEGAGVYLNAGSTLNADYVTFDGNVANAGALYARNANVNLNHAKFINNDIINRNSDYGYVISSEEGGSLIINNSVFANNLKVKANRTNGDTMPGAIAVALINFEIYNSNFTDNSGVYGGAITIAGGNSKIDNCRFINNTAYNGGAIEIYYGIYYGGSVDINNSYFEDNVAAEYGTTGYTSAGGAIAVTDNGNAQVNIEGSTFKHNIAIVGENPHGGAISIQNSKTNIESCVFEENEAPKGGAVYNKDGLVSVAKSNFTDNQANIGVAIFNEAGNLALSGNNVTSGKAEILSTGKVISTVKGKVLNGTTTVYASSENVEIYAVVTDDNGNLINDPNFVFEIYDSNGQPVKTVNATFDGEKYVNTTVLAKGYYTVKMTTSKYTATIDDGKLAFIVGTYTELQMLIDAAGQELDLAYDFAYDTAIDGVAFIDGVVINKDLTINGNNHTISGNDSARIFSTYTTVNLNDIVFKNGKADKGGAIYAVGTLNVDNCTFINNTATTGEGNAVYIADLPYNIYIITDQASYDAVLAIENGPLQKYYKQYPDEDVDTTDPRGHSWTAVQNANLKTDVSELPWIVIDMLEPFNGPIVVSYNGVQVFSWTPSTPDKTYAVISVTNPGDCGMKQFALWGNTTGYPTTEVFEPNAFMLSLNNEVISSATPVDRTTSIEDSTFTDNGAATDYAIYNEGNLSLDGNTVSNLIYNKGTLNSQFTAEVLNNKTYETAENSYKLNATLTDDSGNKIYDPNFKFVVNGVEVAFDSYDNGLYTVNAYPITTDYAVYIVNATSTNDTNLVTKISIIKNLKYGTFTDLQERIDKAILAGVDLILPYDFKYNEVIDGATYKDGVVINGNIKIDGNGTTISGNNTARIFNVINGATLTLTNATLTKGNATNGSAINSNGKLELTEVTFSENVAVDCGGAIYNDKGTVNIEACVFDKNDLTNRKDGYTKDYGGAAIYSVGGTLNINGSKFTNNLLNYYPGENGENRDLITAAITSSGVTVINNTAFENNSGCYGADVNVFKSSKITDPASLTIDNSNFTNTKSYAGGIQITNIDFTITNSNFNNCIAYSVGTTGYTASGGALFATNCNNGIIKNTNFTNCGNTQGGAIDIEKTTSLLIDGCTFENNSVSTQGGALAIVQPAGDVTITNTDFINNSAKNAGAIYYWTVSDNKLTISDCEFENNSATDSGAAVYALMYPAGSVDVSNSNFTNNNATKRGAAIFFYTSGSGNELTISNSNFTDNSAATGEAIYTYPKTVTKITDSNFTNNGEATDYAIYNKGNLTLTNTKVDNLVYSSGKFNTELNATFLENKTWNNTGLGDIYILNATLTDQNGNKIYDPNFRFAVNGVNITDIPKYDETTGLYTIGYYIATAGPKVISTNYQATNLKTYDGILDIAKANVTEFTVSVIDTLEGDNATVIITLIGINDTESKPIKLNATVRLLINNKEIPVTVENGTATVPIENLTRGAYPVYVLFDGDSNYNKAINSTEFYVKGNSTLTINDVVANYSDVIEVTIKLTDGQGNPLTGIVVIEEEFEVLVQNGTGVWTVDMQPDVGELTYTAVYNGTNDVFGSVDGFKITINPKVIDPNDVVVDIPQQSEFGKDIPVTITSPVDGNYTVNVNGTTVNVEVVNSTGNATIPALATAGYYNATVTIVDGNYSLDKTTDDFEYFTTPEFNAVINGTYPTAEISITGPAGTYHVLIDGFETINITREASGLPTIYTIPDIAAGNYTAWVSFDANDEYYGYAKDVNFTVEKANSTITIGDIADTVYGNPVVFNYTVAPDTDFETIGVYTIDGGDVQAVIVAEDDKVIIYNLTAGEYVIRIHTPGNDNYTALVQTKAFKVTKAEAITITVDNETSLGPMGTTNVTVTIAGDATGNLFIDNDGDKFFAELVNGSYTFQIYDLTAGEYVINVTYLGDANYNKTNLVKVLNIPKGNVTPVIGNVTAEIIGGQNATFTVDIDPDFATGNVTVFVDGVENQVVVLDADYANATVTISGLGNGTHTIAVQYNGNDNYLPSANVTTTVTVTRAGSKVTINDILDSYNGNVTVNYAIENETDNVTISITDAKGNSYEGIRESGSIILTNLPAGKYTVTINNGQDAYYEESEANATFYVYDNVVTKDNFYAYFDENGKLRDIVPFDELIFKGKFADLVDVITIDRPLIITGEDAVLNNICIDVQSDDVTISNLNMSVIVGDVNAIAINVAGVDDVNIIGNNIYFESAVAVDNITKSAIAINIEHAENIIVEGNKITTLLNGVDANYVDGAVYAEYGMMGVSNVNPIRILGSEAITFTGNDVNSSLKGIVGYWPTIQAVLAVGSKDLLVDNNNFTMVDDITPAGTPSYLYAFTFGFDEDTTISNNNFYMSTTGGVDAAGTAYAIQIVSSVMDIIGNNITSVSNGPNLGIYAVADWYGMGPAVKLYIADNNINVTGYAANVTNNKALVSGIEVGAGKVEVDNNVINVYNKAGYVEGAYVHGISYAQGYSGPTFNIHNNEIYVNDGDYAVGLYSAYGVVVDNYLVAHDLHGDDAVDYLYDAVVKYNFPQDLKLIVDADDVYVNSAIEIYVYTNDLFNGKVIVTVNGKDEEVNITDGLGFLELSSLPASKYNVTAKYAGDLYFLADEDNCTFEVYKYESVLNITTGEVVIDQDLFVNITLPFATGEVTVSVDGNVVIVNLVDGEGNFTIPKANMTNGTHSIVAVFAGDDDYESAQADLTFTVPKAEDYPFNVNLTIDDIDYGKDVTFNVTLPEDATGNVNVYVDGKPVTYAPVVEGNATVTIPASAFTTGNHTITVSYGDKKYAETNVTKQIEINKLVIEISASAADISLDENATVFVTLSGYKDGKVFVEINGIYYPVIIKDGKGNATISGLSLGNYTAYVSLEDDSVYEDAMNYTDFKVVKADPSGDFSVNVTVPTNTTTAVFTITAPKDATGYLLVDIDGKQYYAPVENGTATLTVTGLTADNYTANVTYTGDDKYDPISQTTNVTVPSNLPDDAISIPNSTSTLNPTYGVNLPADATGYIEVDVDGKKYYAVVENGKASVSVPGLSTGQHNVTVTYSGDDKYTKISKSATVTLTEPIAGLSGNKDISVIYSGSATYKVLVTLDGKAAAGETVTFKYNGKTYTAVSDANGYATLKLDTKVKVKTYTITATYKGVTVTNKVKVKHILKVKNKKVKKSKKVTKVKIKLKKLSKTTAKTTTKKSSKSKAKYVKVKFRGKTYKVKVKKRTATWKVKKSMVKKLKVGKKYKYTVTYGKDKVTKKLKIKK